MQLKLDNNIYIILGHGIVDNILEKDAIQREKVYMDEINIDDFEYQGNEKLTKEAYLKYLVYKGAGKRYDNSSEIRNRLEIELELVISKGLTDCFLVAHKLLQNINEFTNVPIPSTALNSLVCYCLGLHDCDPIKYGLSYERFFYLNILSIDIFLRFKKETIEVFNKSVLERLAGCIKTDIDKKKIPTCPRV